MPRTLSIVFLTVFLDLVGFGILIPIQPFYAEYFGARPATVTLLSASFSLMQFLFAPMIGRLSDRIGRRPVMLATIALNATGYALFAFAESVPMLFLARMTSGLGSANLGTAQAIIADSTPPEERARGMGLIGAAFGLGFIVGPAIGGYFGQFGLAAPPLVAAVLSTVNWVFAYAALPETHRPGAQPVSRGFHVGLRRDTLAQVIKHRNVPQILWLYLIGTIAFSLMEQVLGLFIEHTWLPHDPAETAATHLRRAAALTATFMIVVGVASTAVQGIFVGRLAKRFGERRLLIAGTGTLAVAMALMATVGTFKQFVAVGPLLAVGAGLMFPSLASLLSRAVATDTYGGSLGVGQSLAALGRVLGPAVAGLLFEMASWAPFTIAAVLNVTCVCVAVRLHTIDPEAT